MAEKSSIVTVVDATRSELVIWWSDTRSEPTASMSRNCGAWVLPKADVHALSSLTSGKSCLATKPGLKALESVGFPETSLIDPNATLAGVLSEQMRLQTVFDAEQVNRKVSASMKPLNWPERPAIINLETVRSLESPKVVQRALGIARWVVLLAEYWESIEQIRQSRPVLKRLAGGDLRPLPLVHLAATAGRQIQLQL